MGSVFSVPSGVLTSSSSGLSCQLLPQKTDGDLLRLIPGLWDTVLPASPSLGLEVKVPVIEPGNLLVAATSQDWPLEVPTGQEPWMSLELGAEKVILLLQSQLWLLST